MVVLKSVWYLVYKSDLYKDANVQIDTKWLETMNKIDNGNRKSITTIMHEVQSINSIIDSEIIIIMTN